MQVTLEFTITARDAQKMSEALQTVALESTTGYEQDATQYASDLMAEIADRIEEHTIRRHE